MANSTLTHRLTCREDLETLKALMDAAIAELQKPFLDEKQIKSSRAIRGLDAQLIEDGTYFIVEADGQIDDRGGEGFHSAHEKVAGIKPVGVWGELELVAAPRVWTHQPGKRRSKPPFLAKLIARQIISPSSIPKKILIAPRLCRGT